ncbi:hypothetical protein [Pseudomonas sp. KCJK8927]|uniref:hypothetical protein n=1 Tax=Pseudomonas sp. KCJK8927 TaxID=3344560 RepID=UPI0039069D6F
MHAFSDEIASEQRRLAAINDWFLLYDDVERRRDCPNTHHEQLLRRADEMDRLGLVEWTEWRDLRRLADQAFLKAIAGDDYHMLTPSGAGCLQAGASASHSWLITINAGCSAIASEDHNDGR